MANEITLNASIVYNDAISPQLQEQITNVLASVSLHIAGQSIQSIATSATLINLMGLASLGWSMFVNLDPVNFVELEVSSGGAKFAKMLPNEFVLCRLGSGAQAPAAIANTAAINMAVLLCSP